MGKFPQSANRHVTLQPCGLCTALMLSKWLTLGRTTLRWYSARSRCSVACAQGGGIMQLSAGIPWRDLVYTSFFRLSPLGSIIAAQPRLRHPNASTTLD